VKKSLLACAVLGAISLLSAFSQANASSITINGKTYSGENSIVVNNDQVIIDGRVVTPKGPVINISVVGPVGRLQVDACNQCRVSGNVTGGIKTMSGDVTVTGTVTGSVETVSGNVEAGSIHGDVSTMSGDIGRK
jgi:hypothetical protein